MLAPPKRLEPEVSDDTLLVRFRPTLDRTLRSGVVADHGAAELESVPGTRYVLVDTNDRPPAALAAELARDSRIADVELNYIRRASGPPDDPYYEKGIQPYLQSLRLPQAWGVSQGGSSGAIAVLDTGVDLDHPQLDSRVLPGKDLVNDDGDAQDDNGHGTLVAGIAAAETDDGVALAGAAWEAPILPVKVLNENGFGNDADIAAGIVWAADNGATVINVSLAGPGDSAVLHQAIDHALAKDVVVIAAAGNTGSSLPQYPAAYDGVVAVAATDWAGNALPFSAHGSWIDVAAPGQDLISTRLTPANAGWYELGLSRSVTGTSFSAALVSGIAHLLRSEYPAWSSAQVRERLTLSATDLGPPGIDDSYGAGLADAYAALGGPPAPPIAPPSHRSEEPNDTPSRASRALFIATFNSFRAPGDFALAPHGDVDWLAFDVPWAADVAVSLGGAQKSPGRGADYRLELFDRDLRLLARTDLAGVEGPESALASLDQAGRFYAKVTAVTGTITDGAYGLSAEMMSIRSIDGVPGFLYPEMYGSSIGNGRSAAIADITGDGRADLLATGVIDDDRASFVVFPQISDGWLGEPVPIPLPPGRAWRGFLDLAAEDFDRDGLTDVALSTEEGIRIYRQRGAGMLSDPLLVPGSAGARQLEAGDLNSDGRPDLAVLGDGLRTFLNTPAAWSQTRFEELASEVEVGDVTGDGRTDIVTISSVGSRAEVHVFRQEADGGFTRVNSPASTVLSALAIGDVTGDGRADVIAADDFEDKVLVLPQTAAGELGSATSYLARGVQALETADMNGDGRTDVVTAGYWTGVLFQRSDGTLASLRRWQEFSPSLNHKALAIGDVTSDGALDFVLTTYEDGVLVHRQRSSRWPLSEWVLDTAPSDFQADVSTSTQPQIRLARDTDPASISSRTIVLLDGYTGASVPAEVSYDAPTRTIALRPHGPLALGRPYAVRVANLRDVAGNTMLGPYTYRFRVGASPVDTTPPDTAFRDGFAGPLSHSASPAWYGTEPGVRFECSYDERPEWYACGESWDPARGDGTYQSAIRVRAIDLAGNVDSTPAERTWIFDSTRPRPLNDDVTRAQAIAGSSGRVSGTTVKANYRHCNVGGIEHSNYVFYRWHAPAAGRFTFETNGSSFDTVLGVYDPANEFCPAVMADDDSGSGFESELTFTAEADVEYVVVVGGFRTNGPAAAGDIVLSWHSALAALANTTLPEVTGTARVGELLTSNRGDWSGDPAQYLYQWRRCGLDGSGCRNVSGATGNTYRIAATDAGATIQIVVTAVRPGARTSAASAATAPVVGPPLVITGDPIRVGSDTARVNVRVRAYGAETAVQVSFGPATDYGNETAPIIVPASFDWRELEFDLAGLSPGLTYSYRATARNSAGEVGGETRTFATPAAPSAGQPTGDSAPDRLQPPPHRGEQEEPTSSLAVDVAPTVTAPRPEAAPTHATPSVRLRIAVVARRLFVSRRAVISARLRCPSAAAVSCRGAVRLVASGARVLATRRVVAIQAGTVVSTKLHLTRSGIRLLSQRRRLPARLYYSGRDDAGRSVKASVAVLLTRRG